MQAHLNLHGRRVALLEGRDPEAVNGADPALGKEALVDPLPQAKQTLLRPERSGKIYQCWLIWQVRRGEALCLGVPCSVCASKSNHFSSSTQAHWRHRVMGTYVMRLTYLVNTDLSCLRLTSVYSAEAMVASGVLPWHLMRPRSRATLPATCMHVHGELA
jgi:hypothetical protein